MAEIGISSVEFKGRDVDCPSLWGQGRVLQEHVGPGMLPRLLVENTVSHDSSVGDLDIFRQTWDLTGRGLGKWAQLAGVLITLFLQWDKYNHTRGSLGRG